MALEKDCFYITEVYRFRLHKEEGARGYIINYERKVGETWEKSYDTYPSDAEVAMWEALQDA